jgi:competence protein ComEC
MELLQQLRKVPFLRIVLPYLAGLLAGYHIFTSHGLFLLLISGTLVVISLILLNFGKPVPNRRNMIFGMCVTLMLFILSAVNIVSRENGKTLSLLKPDKPTMSLMLITDNPEIKKGSVRMVANIRYLYHIPRQPRLNTRVLLTFPRNMQSVAVKPGDELLVNARFLPVKGPGNPCEFDYREYMSYQGIDYQVFIPEGQWKVLSHNRINLKILAVHCRDYLLEMLRSADMEPRVTSVLSALTLGYKNDLEARTTEVFTKAGVIHVMALSGFNVAIIYLLISFMLGFLKKSRAGRIVRLLIALAVIWTFAIITGLSSSVTRACVMITIMLAGKFFNRDASALNIISASAFLILVVSPFQLMDVGFQLSYAAVLGIVYVQPYFYRTFIVKNYIVDKLWALFTVSVAAQMATSPLTLHYFHQFPFFFWISNLYVVPMVTLIIYVTGAFMALSFLEPIKLVTGNILEFLVKALLWPLDRLGDFPGVVADGIYINSTQVILLFMILLLIMLFIRYRKPYFMLTLMSLLLVNCIINTLHLNSTMRQHIISVNQSKGTSIVNIISGRNNLLMSFGGKPPDEKTLNYSFRNLWIKKNVFKTVKIIPVNQINISAIGNKLIMPFQQNVIGKNYFFSYRGISMIICTDDCFQLYNSSGKFKADYLVITGNIRPETGKLIKHFKIGILLIDSSVNYYTSLKWVELCRLNNLKCWSVNDQGAFVIALK